MAFTRSLRILVLAPQPLFESRGTPIAVRRLAQFLGEAGHHVDVLSFSREERGLDLPYHLHAVRLVPGLTSVPPGFSWRKLVGNGIMLPKALSLLQRYEHDLIHAVEEAAFVALAIRMLRGTPYIYDMDSALPDQLVDRYPLLRSSKSLMERLETAVMRHSTGVIAVCRALEERVTRASPASLVCRLEDVSLLDGGTEAGLDLRAHFGIDGQFALYVGNLESYQGIDLLMESFSLLARAEKESHLVIIGGENHHIEHYGRRAETLKIGRRVHFAGPRPLNQLGTYLRQADVLVSPRVHGVNTPMKIFSYMDSGTAILATKLETHTQVLDSDVAFLAPPEPAAFADGLRTLLGDPALRRRLAEEGRRRAEREYSPHAYRQKLLRFYEDVALSVKDARPNSGERGNTEHPG